MVYHNVRGARSVFCLLNKHLSFCLPCATLDTAPGWDDRCASGEAFNYTFQPHIALERGPLSNAKRRIGHRPPGLVGWCAVLLSRSCSVSLPLAGKLDRVRARVSFAWSIVIVLIMLLLSLRSEECKRAPSVCVSVCVCLTQRQQHQSTFSAFSQVNSALLRHTARAV